VADLLASSFGKSDAPHVNKLLASISNAGQKLKHISTHPAISVTSLDVLFTAVSLFTWTFTRDLDVHSILESSVLSFLVPSHEKHVTFKEELAKVVEEVEEPSTPLETTTPRKRGRPSKKANGSSSSAQPASSAGPVRRSTRGKVHSPESEAGSFAGDPDATHQPTEETKRAVEAMESDGAPPESDLVSAGEATALAMFLAFLGGLGQLASGTLGAEVAGPWE